MSSLLCRQEGEQGYTDTTDHEGRWRQRWMEVETEVEVWGEEGGEWEARRLWERTVLPLPFLNQTLQSPWDFTFSLGIFKTLSVSLSPYNNPTSDWAIFREILFLTIKQPCLTYSQLQSFLAKISKICRCSQRVFTGPKPWILHATAMGGVTRRAPNYQPCVLGIWITFHLIQRQWNVMYSVHLGKSTLAQRKIPSRHHGRWLFSPPQCIRKQD